jgi:hypothetical protein
MNYASSTKKKKNSNIWKIVWGIAGFVVGIGVGLYFSPQLIARFLEKPEIELFNESGLKISLPQERLKLKDYFIFNLGQEIVTECAGTNVRKMTTGLIKDLNRAIAINPNTMLIRECIVFTGGFIDDETDLEKFNDLILSEEGKNTWIVIKKNHNEWQYQTEERYFCLKKYGLDYHEFKNLEEAVHFLQQNDGYFKK